MKRQTKLNWAKASVIFAFITFLTGQCFSQEHSGSHPKSLKRPSSHIEGDIVTFNLNDVFLRLDEDLVFEKERDSEGIEDDIWFQEGKVFYSYEDFSQNEPYCQIDSDNIEGRVVNAKMAVLGTDDKGNTISSYLIGIDNPSSVTIPRGKIIEVDKMRISLSSSAENMYVMFVFKVEGQEPLKDLQDMMNIFYGHLDYLDCVYPFPYFKDRNFSITAEDINYILGSHLSLMGL